MPLPADQLRGPLLDLADEVGAVVGPDRARVFRSCWLNTPQTTFRPQPDGTVFVVTGDIPAMWLRDSAAQARPYLVLAARDTAWADALVGICRLQLRQITLDPYANAFNATPSGACHAKDFADQDVWVWERKYEVDSLCYPVWLAAALWRATGRTDHLTSGFAPAARAVLDVWRREQDHTTSSYAFRRAGAVPPDTLSHDGRGAPVGRTGMTWSGFRPSDDACTYGYLVPANAFATVALADLAEVAEAVLGGREGTALAAEARELRAEVLAGLAAHGTRPGPDGEQVWAYEVDGLGRALLADDANVPSLLSLPYLGFCAADDATYLATRRFVLSPANPTFAAGALAAGIGSPHTPDGWVWHLAIAMAGLTATDPAEREAALLTMERTTAGTDLMHEGFDPDDPTRFTRPWFSWPNALYCELVMATLGIAVPGFSRPG